MRRVFLTLLADIVLSAALLCWGVRMLSSAEISLPVIGRLSILDGLSPKNFGMLLIAVNGVSLAIALWQLIPLARQFRLSSTLADSGVCVPGVVTDLRASRVIRVNSTTAVRLTIRCTTPSGLETEVKSPIIWAPETQCGDRVDVIFDPMDEHRYYIRLRLQAAVRDSLREKGKRRLL